MEDIFLLQTFFMPVKVILTHLSGKVHVETWVLGRDAKVRLLLTPLGGWNIPLIRSSFSAEEVEAILIIPTGSHLDDYLLWHLEKDDNYSVKSRYKLGRALKSVEVPSESTNSGQWKVIWRLRIPSKIKMFIWKACRNWIPTLFNLAGRGIPSDGTCLVCSNSAETKSMLYGIVLGLKVFGCLLIFVRVLSGRITCISKTCLCFITVFSPLVIWNFCVLCGGEFGIRGIKDIMVSEGTEWKMCKIGLMKMRWKAPDVGVFKVNTDAAIMTTNQVVGVGIVVRDSNGQLVGTSAQNNEACFSPSIAEAVAILRGLRFVVDAGLFPAVLEVIRSELLI
ncbi:hypothetical protein Ddye_016391 [Dipteronia dyeriana]|uniref:RNase H type-1 domain-containing protein n=1 Tax=Dipteronia dyeriana TaxID=168575 RepID=A0AAD9X088_9ROSI|nr:hypothetical protein Ddye_016391 [Dipteronia dyeriana]